MLKQLLIKCSDILNRDDISSTLKNISSLDEVTNTTIQNDIARMISYYNFTISNIYENYLQIQNVETLSSDENNRIYFSNFNYIRKNTNGNMKISLVYWIFGV